MSRAKVVYNINNNINDNNDDGGDLCVCECELETVEKKKEKLSDREDFDACSRGNPRCCVH